MELAGQAVHVPLSAYLFASHVVVHPVAGAELYAEQDDAVLLQLFAVPHWNSDVAQ